MSKADPSSKSAPAARSEVDASTAPAVYRMEEAVKRTGLTPRAIRYYEEMSLLTPSGRTAGGFRLFTEAEIALLLRIKELQTLLGFSLAEIKDTLHVEATRAELREAYRQTTDPAARLALLDQAVGLAQSQVRVIDERVARLNKLRQEQEQRLDRLRAMRRQVAGEGTEAPGASGAEALSREAR